MWQRFTERARKVVFYAQEAAQASGDSYVDTQHLLLGLLRETDTVAAVVLDRLGTSLEEVEKAVRGEMPKGDSRPSQDMVLAPRAKRIIDLAYDEARNLNNNYIGTEHLLLGLIREGHGASGKALEKCGVTLSAARDLVVVLQGGPATGEFPPAAKELVFSGVLDKIRKAIKGENREEAVIAKMVLVLGNAKQEQAFGELMSSLQVTPITWAEAQGLAKESSSPDVILSAAFALASVAVIFLPEAEANGPGALSLMFRAGIAHGKKPSQTMFVQIGETVNEGPYGLPFQLTNNLDDRRRLISALVQKGCACHTTTDAWKTAGDFGGSDG
jgi:hypothetical protein